MTSLLIRTFGGTELGNFRCASAEEAEAVTLLQAVKWAKQRNLQNLVIEGDNSSTILDLQGKKSKSKAILDQARSVADTI